MADLHALIEQWRNKARRKFAVAERTADPMGKRLIEHGAMCYFNCAEQLEEALANGSPVCERCGKPFVRANLLKDEGRRQVCSCMHVGPYFGGAFGGRIVPGNSNVGGQIDGPSRAPDA